jgi:hypothetical protein
MRWMGHVARMGEKRNTYRLLVGKPEWRRPLGRSRRRWLDNIRMDLVEFGWGDVDWIGLAQDRDRWRALWIRYWTFGFHKMLGNYRVSKQLGVSRVVLSSVELVRNVTRLWNNYWTISTACSSSRLSRHYDTHGYLNLGCLHPVACVRSRWGGFIPSTQHYYRRLIFTT